MEQHISKSRGVSFPQAWFQSIRIPLDFPLILLLLITTTALFSVLRAPPAWVLDVGAPGDTRFLYGFSIPEVEAGATTTFRWSTPASRLVLHGANVRPSILEMRLYGERLAADNDQQLVLARDDRAFAAWQVADGWREYKVLLPEQALGAGVEVAHLEFVSDTHRPGARDGRDLGVVVDWVGIVPLTVGDALSGRWLVLQRTLMLVWGLVVLAGGLQRIGSVFLPRRRQVVRAAGFSGVGLAALGLELWAWRNPYTLAWALPPTPWLLGLTTLLLVSAPCISGGRALLGIRESRLPGDHSPMRFVAWIGLGLLVTAQVLLNTQWAVGAGIALTLVGLWVFVCADAPHQATVWEDSSAGLTRTRAWLFLVLIFAIALGMRFYRIADLPFGLWRDEARHGLIALRILEDPDYRPIYVASGRVNMPALGFYPFALAFKVWGVHDWTMRAVTALVGALTVFPLYLFVAHLSRWRHVALLAAVLLAVSSWHVTLSRFSFPSVFEPLFGLLGLWLLLVGVSGMQSASGQRLVHRMLLPLIWILLAGMCLGLAVQAYHTGRMVPVVAAVLALLLLWQHRQMWRRWLSGMVVLALGFLLAVGPLLTYAINRPEAMNDRVGRVFLLNEDARKGRAPLATFDDEAVGRHLLMFNVRGDSNGRHHAPERPMLDFVTGIGFLVGCATLLRFWRDWRSLLLLAALGIGLVPSALAVEGPHAMRSIGAAAFACTIAAVGWAEIWRVTGVMRAGRQGTGQQHIPRGRWAPAAGWLGVALLALALNAWTYFGFMAVDSRVWGSFYPVHTQIGTYLRSLADEHGHQALDQIHVPANLARNAVFTYMAHDLPVRMFDSATLASQVRSGDLVVLSGYTYREDLARFAAVLGPTPSPVLRGPNFPSGGEPSFVVYRVP